jgi:PAS domain-containing protein
VPYFICPNCKERSVDIDGKEGFTNQAAACRHCGFGFLFELLEDYYPAPSTGLVVCDADGRVLSVGRGVFELSGFDDRELMGRDVVEAFGLSGFEADKNPARIATEWGVRRLGEKLSLRTRAGLEKAVTADFFPAYDEDGGLLVALTPRSNGASV